MWGQVFPSTVHVGGLPAASDAQPVNVPPWQSKVIGELPPGEQNVFTVTMCSSNVQTMHVWPTTPQSMRGVLVGVAVAVAVAVPLGDDAAETVGVAVAVAVTAGVFVTVRVAVAVTVEAGVLLNRGGRKQLNVGVFLLPNGHDARGVPAPVGTTTRLHREKAAPPRHWRIVPHVRSRCWR